MTVAELDEREIKLLQGVIEQYNLDEYGKRRYKELTEYLLQFLRIKKVYLMFLLADSKIYQLLLFLRHLD